MNFFKRDDGILDVITKAITVVSFIFGIWIYFHTIHPVFQKESELQDLRKEKVNIQTDNERLSKETAKIKNDLHIQTEKIKDLNERAGNLSLEIESKNSELASINEKLEIAHNEAVLSKLNLIMDKIISAYLISIVQGKNKEFNVIEYSHGLIEIHDRARELNIYDKEAYSYFVKYLDENKSRKFITDEEIFSYAIMIPYGYKMSKHLVNTKGIEKHK
ncbi:hypothetical protein RFJ04_003353 [Klebsiella variicola]|nr:hypothetical protein [Klebsiella variicola]